MLRNIINGVSTTEIYQIGVNMYRGSIAVKNLSTKKATKASGAGVGTYFVDLDFVPTGHQSDMEISDYDNQADIIHANTYGIMRKLISGTWGTDQIDVTNLTVGDYLVAGTSGKAGTLVKANSGKTSPYRYVGKYDDAGHMLHMFEIVEPHTV